MTTPLVEVENLNFSYTPDSPEILKDLNLVINKGDYLALIGQNGSGKTTLSKIIGGLLMPNSGEVRINSIPLKEMSIQERTTRVGYCYQNPDHQIFLSTIEDEVAFGPKNLNLPPDVVEKQVCEALTAVGLLQYRKEEPYFAGKGERQKVAVASVLAMRPNLIVLDEPTTGLDWRDSENMMRLIHDIWQAGHTIMIITHNMRLVTEHTKRAIVMRHGEIVLDGTPEEVFLHDEELAKSFVNPPQVTRLWRAVSGKGNPWMKSVDALPEVRKLFENNNVRKDDK